MAVRDEEHMVSTAMLGPLKLKKYDKRLAMDDGLPASATGLPLACSWAP
jgi:hypothetical protein